MRIRISHPDCPTSYEIRPCGTGCCFEIFKDLDKVHQRKTASKVYDYNGRTTGRYPSTLRHAIDMTVGLIQNNPKSTDGIEIDISTEQEKISEYYKEWIDKLRVEVMDDLEEVPHISEFDDEYDEEYEDDSMDSVVDDDL